MDQRQRALDRLALCTDEAGARLAVAYFDPANGFAGSTFDTLGDNRPDRMTRDDLLALTCLDEHVPPGTLRELLSAECQQEVGALLASIDSTVALGDADDAEALDAAGLLWTHLKDFEGVASVKAGKLIARKRPRLIPVIDTVVTTVVAAGKGEYWTTYRAFMTSDVHRSRLDEVRRSANADEVSLLRVLDAAVWMRGSGSTRAVAIRDRLSIPDLPWAPRPSSR